MGKERRYFSFIGDTNKHEGPGAKTLSAQIFCFKVKEKRSLSLVEDPYKCKVAATYFIAKPDSNKDN